MVKKGNCKNHDEATTNLMMQPLPSNNNKNKDNNNKNNKNNNNNKGSSISKKVLLLGRLDSCHNCIRYILVVGNCIFFLLGCTIIGLGIYIVVDKVSFVTGLFGLTLVAPASYLILASGCVVFIISFIGCFGSLFESRALLAIYSGFLAVVLALSCIGFSLAVIFRSNVTDQIRLYMHRTVLYDYGINPEQQWNLFVTKKWDQAQVKWQCCAVKDNTWTLYRESSWYKVKKKKALKDKFANNPDFHYDNLDDNNTIKNYGSSYNNKVIEDQVDLLPLVPKSCCKINPQGQYVDLKTCGRGMEYFKSRGIDDIVNTSSQFTMAINAKGCYEEGTDVMKEISSYLICIGVITAVVVIGGLIISIQLARTV